MHMKKGENKRLLKVLSHTWRVFFGPESNFVQLIRQQNTNRDLDDRGALKDRG